MRRMANDIGLFEGIDLFENFWQAGMRKVNKKAARKIFQRLLKEQSNPHEFVEMLSNDVKHRIRLKQFGFDAMHPTTYLNGERWEDEMPKPRQEIATQDNKQSFQSLHDNVTF